MRAQLSIAFLLVVAACGPGARGDGDGNGNGNGTVDAAPVTGGPEVCNDGGDNDGDGKVDCGDTDCSGVGDCPVCGSVMAPQAAPLALPDGVSSGAQCSVDSQCGAATPNCVHSECHASYTSTLDFIGFPDGAKLTDPTKLLKICVKIEHSWLRDLQMEVITPDNNVFILDRWFDRDTYEEIYLGDANDLDSAATPVAGTGMDYCWTPTGTAEMIDHTSGVSASTKTSIGSTKWRMNPGDYMSSSAWGTLANSSLNGKWTMRVTDLWGQDNGFMFNWSISFDPSLVNDCNGPIIL